MSTQLRSRTGRPLPGEFADYAAADIAASGTGAAAAGTERWAQARADDAIDMPAVLKRLTKQKGDLLPTFGADTPAEKKRESKPRVTKRK